VSEIRRKLSDKGSDYIQDDRWYDGLLDKLVIDEYLNRLRVHRWTYSGDHQAYALFDIDKSSSGRYWDFDKRHGRTL
jgi:hypothetical protein